MVNDGIESLIDIHEDLGYLADHHTARLMSAGAEDQDALTNFRELVSQSYSLKRIPFTEQGLPESIACLVIAKPREKFSDFELYQIDQFLMQGKNLALFIDPFEEVASAGQPSPFGSRPSLFKPVETGLERLLEHYGVRVEPAYVLDEHCYRQTIPAQMGGGERPMYHAPIIKNEFINQELPFLKNIKELVAVKAAPVEIVSGRLRQNGLRAHPLIASSERSWEMRERVSFHPSALRPPSNSEGMRSRPLAYLIEGEFPSFFCGKAYSGQGSRLATGTRCAPHPAASRASRSCTGA
jgi:ABC-type uncharacterized transport system involved in gliding motility auxiliary subunit